MQVHEFRNTMREWFREKVSLVDALKDLPLIVTNENSSYGVDQVYMRQTMQVGGGDVAGIGSAQRRQRRTARLFVEIFGPKGEGEGVVSELASLVEKIFNDAIPADKAPAELISVRAPYSFERSEPDRYCQVVSVPLVQDYFA